MKASVVICARNEDDTIRDCVKSVLNQDYPKKDYEVVVVDDGSEDNTPQILEGFSGRIRCFRNKVGKGISYSRNLGVKNTRGEIVCFIDGDAYAEKNWLRNLLAPYDGNEIDGRIFPKELLGGVGGFIGVWNKDNVVARYSEMGGIRIGAVQQGSEVKLSPIGFGTCNTSYPRSLIEEVGGFDEGLVIGGDTDLNLRIMELGYIFLYNPHAKVHHKHPDSMMELMRRWFVRGRYHKRIIEKNPKLDLVFSRIIDPNLVKEAWQHRKTLLFIPLDILVRISFLTGWMFNRSESKIFE